MPMAPRGKDPSPESRWLRRLRGVEAEASIRVVGSKASEVSVQRLGVGGISHFPKPSTLS